MSYDAVSAGAVARLAIIPGAGSESVVNGEKVFPSSPVWSMAGTIIPGGTLSQRTWPTPPATTIQLDPVDGTGILDIVTTGYMFPVRGLIPPNYRLQASVLNAYDNIGLVACDTLEDALKIL